MRVTEATVSHIVEELPTWLDGSPEWVKQGSLYVIDMPVQNSEGLELRFYASHKDVPTATPSYSYFFNNFRIRGYDYDVKCIAADNTILRGWHEHRWSDVKGDSARYPDENFVHVPPDRRLYIAPL